MSRAVVFAYHNVGVRCLSVLLAHGVKIPLVVTHSDNPDENIWFGSVAELAALHDIPVITPDDTNAPEIIEQVHAAQPDFLFSFYYRNMLKKALLDIPTRGAFNMHGSLLPQYRGRVPVNWAIIKGERETGATLHVMNEKPDNGAIVDQQAVPILPDDTALEVFHKVTCAAEVALNRCLPALLAGTAQLKPQDLSQGGYFGGRRPEDGKIDWFQSAQTIHNLVRAVAPPYPGACTLVAGKPVRVLKTLIEPQRKKRAQAPAFYCENSRCYAECGDGKVLRILAFEFDGKAMTADEWIAVWGSEALPLGK
jgi:methionyl-tRNA formyltransferase